MQLTWDASDSLVGARVLIYIKEREVGWPKLATY